MSLEDQARLSALGYADLIEKLAERYHTTPETIRALEPHARFRPAGRRADRGAEHCRGPGGSRGEHGDADWRATLTSLGVAGVQPSAARVVVDKSEKVLMAYDADDHLIAQFPARHGQRARSTPGRQLGRSRACSPNTPTYNYNPKLFWDADPGHKRPDRSPPGPNNPVGVAWIDLSKPHYGIHGTPVPKFIGQDRVARLHPPDQLERRRGGAGGGSRVWSRCSRNEHRVPPIS